MAVITAEKLGGSVGALVEGVDCERLLSDDALPEWIHEALEANGALVFRDLHIDDATQVAFSKRLGSVEVFGRGEHPEIFRVTLDPKKNPSAQYLRGTFDWHIDGCTDDIPIMATVLSAHAVAATGGETEFASSYAAYESLTTSRRSGSSRCGSCTPSRPPSACTTPTPPPSRWRTGAPARPRPTPSCGGTRPAGGRWSSGPPPTTSPACPSTRAGRCSHELLEHSTAPEDVYRHEWSVGDMVIWDNRGVLHRACPYDPTSAARHAPHDPRRRRADPVSPAASERTAIVTGGASGIGLAIAERLAADGLVVAIFDRDGAAADEAAAKISASGGRAEGLEVDVTDRPGIEAAVTEVAERLDRPTVLVNNAGIDGFSPFLKITPEVWARLLEVNLTGTFHCCQVVLPHMLDAGWGRIVNISSSSAQGGQPMMAHYVSSKAAMIGLTKSLALEFGPKGITVNTIPPGFIDTPLLRKTEDRGLLGNTVDHHASLTPVRRVGRPEDIANACAFLVGEEASYVTGQVIGVNGGRNT